MCLSEFILNKNLSENERTREDLNWSGSSSNTDEMERTWEHQSINIKAWVNLHKYLGIWENLDVIWVSEHAKPCEPKWDSMNLTESKPDWVNLHKIRFECQWHWSWIDQVSPNTFGWFWFRKRAFEFEWGRPQHTEYAFSDTFLWHWQCQWQSLLLGVVVPGWW